MSIDPTQPHIRRIIKLAQKTGFITFDKLHEEVERAKIPAEQFEDLMSLLEKTGIRTVKNMPKPKKKITQKLGKSSSIDIEPDDPTRMYLRNMGMVQLLGRDDEMKVATDIMDGTEKTLRAISISPYLSKIMERLRIEEKEKLERYEQIGRTLTSKQKKGHIAQAQN